VQTPCRQLVVNASGPPPPVQQPSSRWCRVTDRGLGHPPPQQHSRRLRFSSAGQCWDNLSDGLSPDKDSCSSLQCTPRSPVPLESKHPTETWLEKSGPIGTSVTVKLISGTSVPSPPAQYMDVAHSDCVGGAVARMPSAQLSRQAGHALVYQRDQQDLTCDASSLLSEVPGLPGASSVEIASHHASGGKGSASDRGHAGFLENSLGVNSGRGADDDGDVCNEIGNCNGSYHDKSNDPKYGHADDVGTTAPNMGTARQDPAVQFMPEARTGTASKLSVKGANSQKVDRFAASRSRSSFRRVRQRGLGIMGHHSILICWRCILPVLVCRRPSW